MLERTERLLACVTGLHQAIQRLQSDLVSHSEALQIQLAVLQKERAMLLQTAAASPQEAGKLPAEVALPSLPQWLEAAREVPGPSLPDCTGLSGEPAPPDPSANAAASGEAPEAPGSSPRDTVRQSETRRTGNLISILIRKADDPGEPVSACVVDRSSGGLAVLTDREWEIGAVLTVRPVHAAEDCPWVPIEVRYCRPEGGQWWIGCRFVHRLSWDKLRLFG